VAAGRTTARVRAEHALSERRFVVIAERHDGRRVVFGTYPNEDAANAMAARLRALCGGASVRAATHLRDVTPGADVVERAA
jgi:hypothetical protein